MSSDPIASFIEAMRLILSAGDQLLTIFNQKQPLERDDIVPHFFLRKSIRLLAAILCLIRSGFEQEAQILARAMLETRINLEFFLILARENPEKAFARVFHAKILEKLKALEATDFKIGGPDIRQTWEQMKQEIESFYSDDEVERLKKYGFSGLSLEARAVKTGNKELYDLAYRLYSAHAHATDLHEQLGPFLVPEDSPKTEETLLPAVLEIACDCGRVVVEECNELLGDPLNISEARRNVEGEKL